MLIKTTLCYIEKDDKYLMLYRNKKKNDINEGKWIGIGGKFEKDESADECLLREVKEETGLVLKDYQFRGVVYFRTDEGYSEDMYLYTSDSYTGELQECTEGELHWIDKDKILDLNLWEGDKYFIEKILNNESNIEMTMRYANDELVSITE